MNRNVKRVAVVSFLAVGAIAFAATYQLHAQQAAPNPESRFFKPGTAPGLKVTDMGRASGHTYRVNMVKGDEIITGLMEFAEKHHIKNGHFSGLGAIDKATFRWSDPVNKTNRKTEVNEEAEVVSLVGSIATDKDGNVGVHVHSVVALGDGTTRGGHLMNARVSIIAEIFVTEEEVPPPASASR